MAGYVLLPDAENDLIETLAYLTCNGSEEVARHFARNVFAQSRWLAAFPGMGTRCHFARPGFEHVLRFRVKAHPSWLIFYRQVPGGIEVHRILHASRDWSRLLS